MNVNSKNIVITSATRTAIGKLGGSLKDLTSYQMGSIVIKEALKRSHLNSKEVEKWPELEQFILHQVFLLNKKFEEYFKEYNFHKLYKELVNFCSLELSAFYFDIRKDTLYCDDFSSIKRYT